MAKPNLERIPGSGDHDAVNQLRRAPKIIDGVWLGTLDKKASLALGRYGARAPSLALREGSTERLQDGLLATAISAAATGDDPRDVMVGLALHFYCAERLGIAPMALFNGTADRLGVPQTADLLRMFGSRNDVTLGSFGWRLVPPLEGGPDFEPTDPY